MAWNPWATTFGIQPVTPISPALQGEGVVGGAVGVNGLIKPKAEQKSTADTATAVVNAVEKTVEVVGDLITTTFISPKATGTKVFDLVSQDNNGKWTVSKHTEYGNTVEQIPHIILTEYRITSSSAIQSLRRSITLLPDLISQLTPKNFSATKLKKLIDENIISTGTVETAKTVAGKLYADATFFDTQPQIKGDKNLAPYQWLYSVVPTGYSYILPYFSDEYFGIQNSWTENSGPKTRLKDLAETILNMPIELANSASFFDPGIYVERPKFYNFDSGDSVQISVNFPLINTHKFEDIDRNLQIIKNLVIQNLPYRINQIKSEIPVIYDVNIPGAAHYPFCYISRLTIKHLGNKRVTKEFNNGTPTLIPDAYMVSITLKTLTDDASNFYMQAFGNNINNINVETHLNGPAQAK